MCLQVQIATRQMAKANATHAVVKAKQRNWEQHAYLTGDSEEHTRIRTALGNYGPAKLLTMLKSRAELKSFERDNKLERLKIEVGALPLAPSETGDNVKSPPRYFLRIRDRVSGEQCLYWEEPVVTRATDPARNTKQDKFTRQVEAAARALDGVSTSSSHCGSSTASSSTPG